MQPVTGKARWLREIRTLKLQITTHVMTIHVHVCMHVAKLSQYQLPAHGNRPNRSTHLLILNHLQEASDTEEEHYGRSLFEQCIPGVYALFTRIQTYGGVLGIFFVPFCSLASEAIHCVASSPLRAQLRADKHVWPRLWHLGRVAKMGMRLFYFCGAHFVCLI